MIREDYEVDQTPDGVKLNRENVSGLDISCTIGLCIADINNQERPRDAQWYLENVLAPGIKSGEIGDGGHSKFDDRKVRFDRAIVRSSGILKVRLGITHYAEYRKSFERGKKEPEKARELHKLGIARFNDKYAFFSRAAGASALVISKDKSVFLGPRLNQDDTGALNAVGGFLTYKERLEDINPEAEALRELEEEFSIDKAHVRATQFVGIFSMPLTGEVDFVYHVNADVPDEFFTSGAWKPKDNKEHGDLIQIASYETLQRLLNEGRLPGSERRWDIFYPARGALESLRLGELKND